MPYYMSVDGGGTKLNVILFNDKFELLSFGRGQGVNLNFDSWENVSGNIRNSIEECLSGYKGISIDKLYVSMAGPGKLFDEILGSMAEVNEVYYLSEAEMSALAGIQKSKGYMALAGTGSGVCYISGNYQRHKGGWGSLLGDQGSGASIGRDALEAIIKAYENWGPKTLLYDLLMEAWELKHLWEIIPKVYRSKSYQSLIASVAPLVSKAAHQGDSISIRILEKAGMDMADQMIALLREAGLHGDIFLAGGAWKGSRIMFDAFSRRVHSEYPQANICIPVFEPVMGGVVKLCMGESDSLDEEKIVLLSSNFSRFLYKADWLKEG